MPSLVTIIVLPGVCVWLYSFKNNSRFLVSCLKNIGVSSYIFLYLEFNNGSGDFFHNYVNTHKNKDVTY